MHPNKKTINLVIDNCVYSPALFQAALDLAVAAKHTHYADIHIIVPQALLYEISGFKATNAEQLLSPRLQKDSGVRKLRGFVEHGLKEGVLVIPPPSPTEKEFFLKHGLSRQKKTHVSRVSGAKSPKDFADSAIVDWLKNHQPNQDTHFIIATQDSPLINDLVHSIQGDCNAPKHLDHFEQFDQACMALWIAEESKLMQAHVAAESGVSPCPAKARALHRLSDSVPLLSSILQQPRVADNPSFGRS